MSKKFWKSALIRALRTFCQAAIATIGTAALLSEVNWLAVASASALSAILSILTSLATGLPEAEEEADSSTAMIKEPKDEDQEDAAGEE